MSGKRSSGLIAAWLLGASAIGLPGQGYAATAEAATDQVRARLVASVDAVHPGAEILLGVNQRIIPHWHTYWKNPGDSGLATTIAWQLPAGAAAGEILWPVPSRFTVGPVTNYAYADEVTLLSPVTVPKDVAPGGVFPVNATVKWLVCEETCIPQTVELAISLPVVSGPSEAGQGSPLIREAQASLPVASPWPVSVTYGQDAVTLKIRGKELKPERIAEVGFFADQWGRISHGAPQERFFDDDGISLKLKPGEDPAPGAVLSGVLVVTENSADGPVRRGFAVEASPAGAAAATAHEGEPELGLASALVLALLGGLVLNLMPCVFPVLSLKALHLLKQAEESRTRTRLHGLAYTAGVLLSFAALGGVLIFLKAGGSAVGWGFQFQSPLFVLATAYLMFVVGLSLSGLLELGGSAAGLGSSLAEKRGYSGSFFTGVLATVVAAPCTAPFMGAAIGYAVAQSPVVLLAVLLSLGFGLALPYLALSHWPLLQRHLPRPGAWMETVKQGLAFPMYATAAWLVWVLAQQAGSHVVAVALGGMVAIAFAAWTHQRTRWGSPAARRFGSGVAAVAVFSALAVGYTGVTGPLADVSAPAEASAGKNWEPYSAARLQALRAEGRPVFLNFTAAWCISCLVNEKVALSDGAVSEAFRKGGVTYLKGDWTNRDPEITAKLQEFGRSGVPLYIHYPAGKDSAPVILPQILTPEIVLGAISPAAEVANSNLTFIKE
ncbi:protein-disulfide reductase DsbD [Methylococcus sp. EFPC2]|uniref:protein-disulfide reductase DsbD family protein n=1 Tax=Methylococcus sp. EFPC2 TaxID=2812648 RepID=UPI0019676F37|nr:thioredoxin family protein [Methylococcus sp. EFPC2]QSA96422.1 thioredoxin family protein [Methylococcus sp. EFPC2]